MVVCSDARSFFATLALVLPPLCEDLLCVILRFLEGPWKERSAKHWSASDRTYLARF